MGNWEWSSLLHMSMKKDDRIRNGLGVRASATADLDFQLLRCEDEPPEVARALDHLERVWRPHVFRHSTQREIIADTTMCGVKAAQEVWSVMGDYWTPQVTGWPTGRLRFYYLDNTYQAMAVDSTPTVPRQSDGREWLVFLAGEDQPWIDGAVRPLALPFFCKGQAVRGWLGYSAVHGQPQKLVKHPAAQRQQQDVKNLVDKVMAAVNGSTIPLPQGEGIVFDVSLLEAQYDTYKTFPSLIESSDRAITITLLAQTETTGGEAQPGGSRAKAEVQERQLDKVIVADTAMLCEGLRPLCKWYLRANLLPEEWAPEPYYQTEVPPSPHLLAEAQVKRAGALAQYVAAAEMLKGAGVNVDWQRLARELCVPLLGDDPAKQQERRRLPPPTNFAGRKLREPRMLRAA